MVKLCESDKKLLFHVLAAKPSCCEMAGQLSATELEEIRAQFDQVGRVAFFSAYHVSQGAFERNNIRTR